MHYDKSHDREGRTELEQALAADGHRLTQALHPEGALAQRVSAALDDLQDDVQAQGWQDDEGSWSSRSWLAGPALAASGLILTAAAVLLLVFLPTWRSSQTGGQNPSQVGLAQLEGPGSRGHRGDGRGDSSQGHTSLEILTASRLERLHPAHVLRSMSLPLSELVASESDTLERDVRRAVVGLTEQLPAFLR